MWGQEGGGMSPWHIIIIAQSTRSSVPLAYLWWLNDFWHGGLHQEVLVSCTCKKGRGADTGKSCAKQHRVREGESEEGWNKAGRWRHGLDQAWKGTVAVGQHGMHVPPPANCPIVTLPRARGKIFLGILPRENVPLFQGNLQEPHCLHWI